MPTREMVTVKYRNFISAKYRNHGYDSSTDLLIFMFLSRGKDLYFWHMGNLIDSRIQKSKTLQDHWNLLFKEFSEVTLALWPGMEEAIGKEKFRDWEKLFDKMRSGDHSSLDDYFELTRDMGKGDHDYEAQYSDYTFYDTRYDLPPIYETCQLNNLPEDISYDWLLAAEEVSLILGARNVNKDCPECVESKERLDKILKRIRKLKKDKLPQYTHDCTNCLFLGRYNEYDLYSCQSSKETTLLARFGNEGGEYRSLLLELLKSTTSDLWREAKKRYEMES